MARSIYLFRLDIRYPEGSHDEDGWPVPGWRPAEWTDEQWDMFPHKNSFDDSFRWPRQKIFRSYAGACRRADLFERYGCTVEIVRSRPVEWEDTVKDHRAATVGSRLKTAIAVCERVLEDTA